VKVGGGHCDVIVHNSEGSVTSAYARLTVRLAPVFNVHPLSQTVTQGARVTFFAESKSSGATNYQWQWNGRNISGQRSNEMSLGNVRSSDEGGYACVVFDGFGRSTSAVARLTVIPLPGVTKAFVNFETPPVHPLALGPDGVTLAACNLPDNRLELFDVSSGYPVSRGSVPVGLDPVSVRFRTSDEAWVVNAISDSISIVDVPTRRVIATLSTLDTPADVAFAGQPLRAYVSCALPNTVQVFDPETRQAVAQVPINGERPKALAVSPDGRTVYVAIFESGNGSTILGTPMVESFSFPPKSTNPVDHVSGPYGGQNPPPNRGAGFSPPINPGLGGNVPPRVAHIVRKSDAGRWMDDNGGDWTEFVSGTNAPWSLRPHGWDLLDHDVAIIDAGSLEVRYARRLMNICMDLAVEPVTGRIAVIGTDAMNEVRFEPNLKGVFLRVRLGLVDPATGLVEKIKDLNPHLDYSGAAVPASERHKSIGDPRAIVWNGTGTRAYIAGMGSDNVIAVDASGDRVWAAPISVGDGPSGLVLDEARDRLYVLNRFASSISVVDTDDAELAGTVPFFDPTPQFIRTGRRHLYDTHKSSGPGHVSCGSCHVDARMDRLAWDLGDPSGTMTSLFTGPGSFHPMKGPMVTITLQDIIGHEPFHWRADRRGLEEFNSTFPRLLAATNELTGGEMAEFKAFLASIHFPPNPFRNFDNSLSTNLPLPGHVAVGLHELPAGASLPNGNARQGLQKYGQGACIGCHRLPSGLSFESSPPDTNGNHRLASLVLGRNLNLPFRGSQLRNLAEKVGMDTTSTNSRAGFGFTFNGRVDSLARFLEVGFPFSLTNDQSTADMIALLLSMTGSDLPANPVYPDGVPSKDVPAAVGRQLTLSQPVRPPLLDAMLSLSAADRGRVDLVAKGVVQGVARGWSYDTWKGWFQSDRVAERLTLDELLALVEPGSELTFTVVPSGAGQRIGIDRDEDGFFDRDELDAGSDPARATSIPLRATVRLGTAQEVIVTFNSVVDRTYRVEFKSRLDEGTWTPLGPARVADAANQTMTDSSDPQARRFYRIVQID
jgi:YVTN family beta-propeller protein